ncbi:MAG: hypothetical protein SVT52_05365 [Planctomycetota bacterium]|nr:hypothetical protein [Planctomycetota bacterium]
MNIRTISLLVVTVFVAVASADSDVRTTGVVTGTNVYVRSGPGVTAYPCAKLSDPARVVVVGRTAGWLKILPPPGCFSVVSRKYVQLDESGKSGTLTGDNVLIRAGGDLRQSDFWAVQGHLQKGRKVRVAGEIGQYYKITPPAGACFWISDRYVSLLSDEGKPATQPTTTPASLTDKTVHTEQTEQEVVQAVKAFQALEQQLQEEYKKPIEQRDLTGLRDKYLAIRVAEGDYLKPYVDARVTLLDIAIKQRRDLQDVESLIRDTSARQQEYQLKRSRIEVVRPEHRPLKSYAAEGVLIGSEIFPGGPAGAKRFCVRDRQTGRTNAYVQCTSGQVDLSKYVGKHVGIFGACVYDKQLALDVVEAEKVIVLDDKVPLPSPPKPLVKPIPRPPKPKPEPKPIPKPEAKPASVPAPKAKLEPEPTPEAKPAPAPKLKPESEPAPLPAPKPKPEPKPEAKPAPLPVPKLKLEPEPTPEAKPAPAPKLKPESEPAPLPAPKLKLEPKPKAKPKPPLPKPEPRLKPKPTTQPSVRRIPLPRTSTTKPRPRRLPGKPSPTTRPAKDTKKYKPLPPTGLPMVAPTTQPTSSPIDESEFD